MQVGTFVLYLLREPGSTLRQLHWFLYPRPLLNARFGDVDVYDLKLEGVTVHYDTKDPYAKGWFFPRYSETRIHEAAALTLFARACKRSEVVLDVGTHLGLYTCLAGALVPEGGRVFGFDIDRRVLDLACTNVALNALDNVAAVHAAAGAEDGTARFNLPKKLNPALALSEGGATEVPLRSVDSFLKEHGVLNEHGVLGEQAPAGGLPPCVLKIDVEGAEMEVLKGMDAVFDAGRPTLFVELHPHAWRDFGTSAGELHDALACRGYTLHRIRDMRAGGALKIAPVERAADLNTNCMLLAATAEETAALLDAA